MPRPRAFDPLRDGLHAKGQRGERHGAAGARRLPGECFHGPVPSDRMTTMATRASCAPVAPNECLATNALVGHDRAYEGDRVDPIVTQAATGSIAAAMSPLGHS